LIVVVLAVRFTTSQSGSPQGRQNGASAEETALDILKKRYARGEITREEYDRMRKDLE